MATGSLIGGINNVTIELQGLKAQISLLLAAYGVGELDLDNIQAQIEAATQDAIDAVLSQVEGLEISIISERLAYTSQLIALQSFYGDRKFFYELFNEYFTLADIFELALTEDAGASTSTITVANTTGLTEGKEYLIEGGGNREIITISSIISPTQFLTSSVLTNSYTNTAKIKRMSFDMSGTGALATDGQVYYALGLDLGSDSAEKTVNIRRTDNDAVQTVYYKDSAHSAWTEAPLAGSNTDVGEAGFRDDSYVLPVVGFFDLKVLVAHGASNQDVTFKHFVGENDTGSSLESLEQKASELEGSAFFLSTNF